MEIWELEHIPKYLDRNKRKQQHKGKQMIKKTNIIQRILFLGSLWGVCEATIGYLLHFLPSGLSGMFMFPIGFYFMYNAYLSTEKHSAVIMTGLIAASIKFIDFFLPSHSPISVINPSMSIILETLVVFGYLKITSKNLSFPKNILLGLTWIVLFTLMQAFITKPTMGLYLYLTTTLILYVIINTIVAGSLITYYINNQDFVTWKPALSKASFIMPATSLFIALVVELGNSLIF